MRDEIKQLLDILDSDVSNDEKHDNTMRLGFILELSNGRKADNFYSWWLSEDLLNIRLNLEEQTELSKTMLQKLEAMPMEKRRLSLLWAVGKANPFAYCELLLSYLLTNYKLHPIGANYQGLVSLQFCLDEDDLMTSDVIDSIIRMTDELKDSSDEQLAEQASWMNEFMRNKRKKNN